MSFEAQYRGTCKQCDEEIAPGDQVCYGTYGLEHERCPVEASTRYEGATLDEMGF